MKVCGVRYGGVNYNTEADGTASPCWENPNGTTSTYTATALGTTTTAQGKSTLTISTPNPTTFKLDDPNIVAITKVSIAGAGQSGAALDTTFTSITSGTVGVLKDKTKTEVTNAAVTITYTAATPGSLNVPLDSNHRPIDHIQFRWVAFTTTWTGTGGSTCATWQTPSSCVGAVGLWQ